MAAVGRCGGGGGAGRTLVLSRQRRRQLPLAADAVLDEQDGDKRLACPRVQEGNDLRSRGGGWTGWDGEQLSSPSDQQNEPR